MVVPNTSRNVTNNSASDYKNSMYLWAGQMISCLGVFLNQEYQSYLVSVASGYWETPTMNSVFWIKNRGCIAFWKYFFN